MTSPTIRAHLAAIAAGEVTKGNVIGIRKALNTVARASQGYSTSSTAPKVDWRDANALEGALERHEPRCVGELHDSGLKTLRNPRYRKRLQPVAHIIADLDTFRLIQFDPLGRYGEHAVPVYRAVSTTGESFVFRNIPWQSGGNGPEILS